MLTVPDKNEAMDPYIKKNAYTFEVDVYRVKEELLLL